MKDELQKALDEAKNLLEGKLYAIEDTSLFSDDLGRKIKAYEHFAELALNRIRYLTKLLDDNKIDYRK